MILKAILAGVLTVSVSGCATITRGTNDKLVVNSTPPAAKVNLSTGQNCDATPCTFKLPRRSKLNVVVSKERCETQTIRVTSKISHKAVAGATVGNVLVGGLIGAGVDGGSGALHDLTPNPVNAALKCK